jgi:hypothetical protein
MDVAWVNKNDEGMTIIFFSNLGDKKSKIVMTF